MICSDVAAEVAIPDNYEEHQHLCVLYWNIIIGKGHSSE
jgi:hypothetical protein